MVFSDKGVRGTNLAHDGGHSIAVSTGTTTIGSNRSVLRNGSVVYHENTPVCVDAKRLNLTGSAVRSNPKTSTTKQDTRTRQANQMSD